MLLEKLSFYNLDLLASLDVSGIVCDAIKVCEVLSFLNFII
jgi:hypothetical protein